MAIPVINDQLDTLNALIEAQNHLISHQNAAIDLLAADKRSQLNSDIGLVAELINNGELLTVMDYGDQLSLSWQNGETNYAPPMNFCHLETATLEDGEQIPVADFEWEYTIPMGMPYDASEAIFASESVLTAGAHNFLVQNDSWGGNDGKYIQFTLPQDLPVGYQIRKSVAYDKLITSGTLGVYVDGAATTPEYTMTPTEGQEGTYLGATDGTGDLNHWGRVALGYNRWSQSNLRQYLNATGAAGTWWVQQNKWDVMPAAAANTSGLLYGYDPAVIQHFKPTAITTVTNNIDGNVVDTTYDRVFLASLEQMYAVPQFPGQEGEYWEYYKRLLGRTTPAPTGQTYARLIKYALNGTTSAQSCFRRSAHRISANRVWRVNPSGDLNTSTSTYANPCAPAVRIGL